MNRYADDDPDIPPQPDADLPPQVEEPPYEDESPPAEAAAPPTPVAAAPAPADDLARQNEYLRQRIAQETQARQQAAGQQIQQWLSSLPPDERARNQRVIEDQLREAEDKRRVMWTIAQRNELQGAHLQEFYEVASAIGDPYAMERAGQQHKRLQDLETRGAPVAPARPGMAGVRPDAGAPQGNQAGGTRRRREDINKQYLPGGPKQGNIEEMDMEWQRNGYYA